MAVPVRTPMIRALLRGRFVSVALIGLISCSAAHEAQRCPGENASGPQPTLSTVTATTATAAASASTTQPPIGLQDIAALPCGKRREYHLGDPPSHALSQQVSDRVCREDSECGDGFCDRGRCAPIWEDTYGQRCTMNCQCGSFLCLWGRCRSCLHHAECIENGNVCGRGQISSPLATDCGGLGPHETHLPREPVRPPPPSMPSPSP
jgi:hypothetical protein